MKNLILTTALAVSVSTPALAENVNARVEDHYREVTRQIPHTERVCEIVEVPIYGYNNGGATAGDVLGGMIIGGLIGKGATGDDKGAAAGAVIGGMVGADRNRGQQVITGYRQENRCHNKTTYTSQTESIYSHSTITWTENGRRTTLEFKRQL